MSVSNTLSSVIPLIFAQGLKALRHNAVMQRLVLNDFGAEVAEKGQVINIPLPSAVAVNDVTPGAYAPDSGNIAPTAAQCALNYWREAPFTLNDKEVSYIVNGVVPIQLSAAVEGLAFDVNSKILGLYTTVGNSVGTAATTPFNLTTAGSASYGTNAVTAARLALTTNLAPVNDRRFVLGPAAEANALGLPAFQYYMYAGTTETIRKGEIGEKFGFDFHTDQQIPTQTAGTLTGTVTANGAQSAGVTTVSIATAAVSSFAPAAGDLITFQSDTQTYAVQSGSGLGASANGNFVIFPAKAVALAGGETVTLTASHVVNLAFHKQAFAFASRPLASDALAAELDDSYMVPDPVSGITLRLTWRREFHRTRLAFDILYGVCAVRPQLAVRVMG